MKRTRAVGYNDAQSIVRTRGTVSRVQTFSQVYIVEMIAKASLRVRLLEMKVFTRDASNLQKESCRFSKNIVSSDACAIGFLDCRRKFHPGGLVAPFRLSDESDLDVKTYVANCAIGQLIQTSQLKTRALALNRKVGR